MSVRIRIDQLVLKGFEPAERQALVEGLQSELYHVLSDRAIRAEWARPRRTPVLRLGRLPLESGTVGARRFGGSVVRAVGKGLKP
jgi:hypothetical protein